MDLTWILSVDGKATHAKTAGMRYYYVEFFMYVVLFILLPLSPKFAYMFLISFSGIF
jgi:hypothetical protein